jgi:hypothetical protein
MAMPMPAMAPAKCEETGLVRVVRRRPGQRPRAGVVATMLLAAAVAALLAAVPGTATARPIGAMSVSAKPIVFQISRLRSPASVTAGRTFRVRGRVANRSGRRARTHRLTFMLHRGHRSWALRRVQRAKPGRSRRFSVRVRVGRKVPAGRYRLLACVRAWNGPGPRSCRSRAIRGRTS